MTAPNTTPGPWEVEPRDKMIRDDVQRPWIGRLDEGLYSALSCGQSVDNAYANAHQIAAAPELYEALEAAASMLPAETCERHGITAALRKARGEAR